MWETLVLRPGRKPLEALASIIAPMVTTAANLADEVDEQKKLVETLRREPGHLGHVLRLRARRDNRRLLVFVDQFEELYTQIPDIEERAAFTACLTAVADDATASYYNPAGLAGLSSYEIQVMHAPFLESTNLDYIGTALPLPQM